jgi:hypothetical protein
MPSSSYQLCRGPIIQTATDLEHSIKLDEYPDLKTLKQKTAHDTLILILATMTTREAVEEPVKYPFVAYPWKHTLFMITPTYCGYMSGQANQHLHTVAANAASYELKIDILSSYEYYKLATVHLPVEPDYWHPLFTYPFGHVYRLLLEPVLKIDEKTRGVDLVNGIKSFKLIRDCTAVVLKSNIPQHWKTVATVIATAALESYEMARAVQLYINVDGLSVGEAAITYEEMVRLLSRKHKKTDIYDTALLLSAHYRHERSENQIYNEVNHISTPVDIVLKHDSVDFLSVIQKGLIIT